MSGSAADAVAELFSTIRRFWWLVLVVTALAVIAAVVATVSTPTTYTARSSLIVASNDRSPDQDAVLVQGYVAYFNDPAYQSQLLDSARIDDGVSVEARAAAASPILLVDATTSDARSAQSGSAAVAQAFRKAINQARNQKNATDVADLRERLNEIRVSGENSETARNLVSDLQERILQIQADRVNMLQVLQLNGGVTQNSPRLTTNLLFAILGGLLLGALAALAADRFLLARPRRARGGPDRDLKTIVEIPSIASGVDGAGGREEKLRELARIVKPQLPESAVLAVTAPGTGHGAAAVASGLAREWAVQGLPTLLVRISSDPGHSSAPRTDASVIDAKEFEELFGQEAGRALAPWVRPGPVAGMWVLEPAVAREEVAFPVDVMYQVMAHTASSQALVILEAPEVVGSADAQVLCAAAGRTILVIDPAQTRSAEVAEAVSILEHLDSGLLGSVLVQPRARTRPDIGRTQSHERHAEGDVAPHDETHEPDDGVPTRPTLLTAGNRHQRVASVPSERSGNGGTGEV